MKKLAFTFLSLCVAASFTYAQKFFYVDTEYILEHVPEYQDAQKELENTSVRWQNEIEAKYAEIDRLYRAYQAEQILLTEEMKKKREDEIIQKEKEAKDFQKSKFGVEGELFKKRQELVKPVQDKVFTAIKDIATQGGYSVVLDKANQSSILYSDERYDKSDEVLKKLGYSPGSK